MSLGKWVLASSNNAGFQSIILHTFFCKGTPLAIFQKTVRCSEDLNCISKSTRRTFYDLWVYLELMLRFHPSCYNLLSAWVLEFELKDFLCDCPVHGCWFGREANLLACLCMWVPYWLLMDGRGARSTQTHELLQVAWHDICTYSSVGIRQARHFVTIQLINGCKLSIRVKCKVH